MFRASYAAHKMWRQTYQVGTRSLTTLTHSTDFSKRLLLCGSCVQEKHFGRKNCMNRAPFTLNFVSKSFIFGWGSLRKKQHFDYVYKEPAEEKGRWPLLYTRVEACKGVYEDEPDPLVFSVCYIDTAPRGDQNMRTVLIVHGMPGSYQDFLPVISQLAGENIRVIVPNMPGFGVTKGISTIDDQGYLQSTEENADFLLSFLSEIGVQKVDLAVAHSAGSSAVLKIGALSEKIKALALICPVPHNFDSLKECPVMLLFTLVRKFNNILWNRAARKYIANMSERWGFSAEDPEKMLRGILAIANTQFKDLGSFAMSVTLKKIPVLAMYTQDDGLVAPDLTEPFLDLLGIKLDQILLIDVKERQPSERAMSDLSSARALQLTAGSHHPHVKYPELFADEILKFVNKIHLH